MKTGVRQTKLKEGERRAIRNLKDTSSHVHKVQQIYTHKNETIIYDDTSTNSQPRNTSTKDNSIAEVPEEEFRCLILRRIDDCRKNSGRDMKSNQDLDKKLPQRMN